VTLEDVFQILRDRDAALVVADGAIRYVGTAPLAPDDLLRAGIAEHRATLIEMFTFAPEGRCKFGACYRLRAEGDPIACPDHVAKLEETPMSWIDEDDAVPSLADELAGCCTPGRPCFDHFDDVFEAWRDHQTDLHLEGRRQGEAA
jgi:hypothetical protein